jgi:FKBP-type peptidyl-prolyl cis-trans isomerase FkpA
MQKIVLCLLSVLFLLSGCFKKETGCPSPKDVIAPPAEQQVIADYLAANNISATKHSSGFYYQISQQGTGESPNNCSSVAINYIGKLSNGTQFDKGTNVVFTLGSLIEGWQKGLPLIKRGGKIMLYIPPALAYGSTDVKEPNGTVVIPANSILIFEISLLDFQ